MFLVEKSVKSRKICGFLKSGKFFTIIFQFDDPETLPLTFECDQN